MVNLRDEIKSIIIKSGWTMSDVVKALNEKHNRNDSVQNLSNKLGKETLRYKEAKDIAEVIGYEIEWKPKK